MLDVAILVRHPGGVHEVPVGLRFILVGEVVQTSRIRDNPDGNTWSTSVLHLISWLARSCTFLVPMLILCSLGNES